MSNDSAHEKFNGVKVLNSSKICSEVKVEVGEKKNTPIKYRYSVLVLNKYSSEVVLLRYYTSLLLNNSCIHVFMNCQSTNSPEL